MALGFGRLTMKLLTQATIAHPQMKIRRERLLPKGGEVVIRVGQNVTPHQAIARTPLETDFHIIPVSEKLGISPDEARYMDAQHRLMLECAYEALENANINIKTTNDRIGVFGGIAKPHYMLENLRHEIPDVLNLVHPQFSTNMNIGLGNDRSYASSRIANKLNLQGPAINVDAACAT